MQRTTRAGFSDSQAFLTVEDVQFENTKGLKYKVEVVANFTLRFLPDTNEVALVRDGEIVYSEILS